MEHDHNKVSYAPDFYTVAHDAFGAVNPRPASPYHERWTAHDPVFTQPKPTPAYRAVPIKRLHPDAKLPVYATDGSAGADLFACIPDGKTIRIDPNHIYQRPPAAFLIKCGISVEIPKGLEIQIRPRSGLALKNAITVLNSPGTIDSDYRGEIGVILINHGNMPFEVKHGDRIAQMVLCPVYQALWQEVTELGETVRGAGGYGHTGK